MHNANEIRHHINAVEQTRKITNAMQLVSSSRFRRVMSHIEYNHTYFLRVQATMRDILHSAHLAHHPYLQEKGKESSQKTYFVIAGDKGLCGAYNQNVLNIALNALKENDLCPWLVTIGSVAADFFRRNGIEPDEKLEGIAQDPSLHNARKIAFDIFDRYDKGLTDEVYLIHTSFYGETKNKPQIVKILPLSIEDFGADDKSGISENDMVIYEPSAQVILTNLIPQYIIGIVFGALVQAYASEHFSRMNAMQSATKNADEMLEKLKMQYNMARQSAITQEILEISGAAEVLKQ